MYGNYEYGAVSYGDLYTIIIVIMVGDVDVIFIANRRSFIFLSENKKNLFVSRDVHMSTFKSENKENVFISQRK